jgi:hypothetical protein
VQSAVAKTVAFDVYCISIRVQPPFGCPSFQLISDCTKSLSIEHHLYLPEQSLSVPDVQNDSPFNPLNAFQKLCSYFHFFFNFIYKLFVKETRQLCFTVDSTLAKVSPIEQQVFLAASHVAVFLENKKLRPQPEIHSP